MEEYIKKTNKKNIHFFFSISGLSGINFFLWKKKRNKKKMNLFNFGLHFDPRQLGQKLNYQNVQILKFDQDYEQ